MQSQAPLSLERGLKIMGFLQSTGPQSFSQIVEHMKLANTTITRLLSALCYLGVIEKLDNAQYRYLGHALAADVETRQSSLQRCAEPFARFMQSEMNNTVLILFWTGQHSVCLQRYLHDSSAPLHGPGHVISDHRFTPWGFFVHDPYSWIGQRIPTQNMPVKKYTKKILDERMHILQRDGYAFDLLKDRNRIAVPIHMHGEMRGFFCLGGTPVSLPLSHIKRYGKSMREMARSCEAMLASV